MDEKAPSAHALEHCRTWARRLERLADYLAAFVTKRPNARKPKQSKVPDPRSES